MAGKRFLEEPGSDLDQPNDQKRMRRRPSFASYVLEFYDWDSSYFTPVLLFLFVKTEFDTETIYIFMLSEYHLKLEMSLLFWKKPKEIALPSRRCISCGAMLSIYLQGNWRSSYGEFLKELLFGLRANAQESCKLIKLY